MGSKRQVVLVVDDHNWAIGRIAKDLKKAVNSDELAAFEIIRCLDHRQIVGNPIKSLRFLASADVIHWLDTFSYISFCSKRLRKKSISTIHHLEDDNDPKLQALSAPVCSTTDLNTFNFLSDTKGTKVRRVNTGFDSESFFLDTDEHKERSRSQQRNQNQINIGVVASPLRPHKRTEFLFQVIRELSHTHSVSVSLVGSNWNKVVPQPSTFKSNVTLKIVNKFLTDIELRYLYNSLDVYVCTSTIEGGPLPVIEAMACGVPIVSLNIGQVTEWRSSIDPHISPPAFDSPDSFAQKIRDVYAQEALETRVRRSQLVFEKWSYRRLIHQYESLWSDSELGIRRMRMLQSGFDSIAIGQRFLYLKIRKLFRYLIDKRQ